MFKHPGRKVKLLAVIVFAVYILAGLLIGLFLGAAGVSAQDAVRDLGGLSKDQPDPQMYSYYEPDPVWYYDPGPQMYSDPMLDVYTTTSTSGSYRAGIQITQAPMSTPTPTPAIGTPQSSSGPSPAVLAVVGALIGLVLGWINCIVLYAFGAMVADTEAQREDLREVREDVGILRQMVARMALKSDDHQ